MFSCVFRVIQNIGSKPSRFNRGCLCKFIVRLICRPKDWTLDRPVALVAFGASVGLCVATVETLSVVDDNLGIPIAGALCSSALSTVFAAGWVYA